MTKGISLHIGVNRVDSNVYRDSNGNPWSGPLQACEFDAQSMQAIADAQGFRSQILLTSDATSAAVLAGLKSATRELQGGDTLFVSYAGHGGQVPDRNNELSEPDEMDETWCLYDRQLIDDELYAAWNGFQPGVRILVISDSCHSGTVARDPESIAINEEARRLYGEPRIAPIDVQVGTYRAFKDMYDGIQATIPPAETMQIGANVVLISGCQDNEVSYDGFENGLFTSKLLRVWNNGGFQGSTTDLHSRILELMPAYQQPNLFKIGANPDGLASGHPFTL